MENDKLMSINDEDESPEEIEVRNAFNARVDDLAQRLNISRFEVLLMTAHGDWKGLRVEPNSISLTERVEAAKICCRVLYDKKSPEFYQ